MNQVKTHVESLGWGFLLAWVFCMFYSGSMDSLSDYVDLVARGILEQLFSSVLPVSFAIVALVAVVALEPKCGSPAQSSKLSVACPVLTAVGTLLMFAPVQDAFFALAFFVLASAATGVGSGLMWVMWGQQYARLDQEAVEVCAPVSAIFAALLCLVTMLMPKAPSCVLVALFPLVSGFAFCRAWGKSLEGSISDQTSKPAAPGALSQAAKNMGRAGFGILAACLFVSVEGSFWQNAASNSLQVGAIFVVSAAFMLVVGSFATSGPRRVTLAYAYRWMCPFMMAGFAALIIAGGDFGAYFAAAVGIASRFAFCLITQMYFASLASRGAATPVQAYGMGWIFVHVGDFLGVTCTVVSEYFIQTGCVTLATVAALCSVAMVAVMMFALGGERFLSWELPGCMTIDGAFHAELGAVQRAAAVLTASDGPASGLPQLAAAGAEASFDAAYSGADAGNVAPGTLDALGGAASVVIEQDPIADVNDSAAARVIAASATVAVAADAVPAPAPKVAASVPAGDPLLPRIEALSDQYKLTKREREVFALLAHGRSVPYIRDALIISKDTAATHTKHIYAKLGVHSRQELISMVEGNGAE